MKIVFVVRVGNYRPDLCKYTIPTIRHWSKEIGAEYVEISQRKWPDYPVTYEKLQIYSLGQDSEWNILIDADQMIRPDFPDPTNLLHPSQVGFPYRFLASAAFQPDRFFLRDGGDIGIAGSFVVSSYLTHDLWEPLEIPLKQALYRTKRAFILDEYTISRNLAKYGLRSSGIVDPPLLDEMLVHLGNEGKTAEQRSSDVQKAKGLFERWEYNYQVSFGS